MNEKLNLIIDQLKNLSLLEAMELVKNLESIFGIDLSQINNLNSSLNINNLNSTPTEIEEEKLLFNVVLKEVSAEKKIAILKIIRNITGLGLKESKEFVDNPPKLLKENITKEEAEIIKKDIETAGGKVEIN